MRRDWGAPSRLPVRKRATREVLGQVIRRKVAAKPVFEAEFGHVTVRPRPVSEHVERRVQRRRACLRKTDTEDHCGIALRDLESVIAPRVPVWAAAGRADNS